MSGSETSKQYWQVTYGRKQKCNSGKDPWNRNSIWTMYEQCYALCFFFQQPRLSIFSIWASIFCLLIDLVAMRRKFNNIIQCKDILDLPFHYNLFKLNELWPYEKHVNQIIFNRTTLWSLALQIFEAFVLILLTVDLSLSQTLLTFLLCMRQTWRTQLILAISLWGYLPLIWKDFGTHMHGLAVYVKGGLPFARDISLENSADS